jgi:hypothetical protein
MFKFGQLILFLSDDEHFAALKHALAYAGASTRRAARWPRFAGSNAPKAAGPVQVWTSKMTVAANSWCY